MKINGREAHSRGQEIVYIYGQRTRRAVYQIEGEWKFFAKVDGEYIEVYHGSCDFSTTCNDRYTKSKMAEKIKFTDRELRLFGNHYLVKLYEGLEAELKDHNTKEMRRMRQLVADEVQRRKENLLKELEVLEECDSLRNGEGSNYD